MRVTYSCLALLGLQSCTASVLQAAPRLHDRGPRPTGTFLQFNSARSQHLERRGAPTCPEDIGGAPYACASDFCGGEDAANPGSCTNANPEGSKCKCTNGGAQPPMTTVTSTLPDGSTVVATYALQTIASLANLRQAITTTVTETTTAADGTTGVETAVAVVMAGGVSWFLAGFLGDAAAAETLNPPNNSPDHPDDNTCPDPKAKCSDCAAVAGVCVTGNPGCGCDEKTCPATKPSCADCSGVDGKCTAGDNDTCECDTPCPTGDDQPLCAAETCKGDDQNKCTVGSTCDCKPAEVCPSDDDTLFCDDDCGGSSDGLTCNGLSDQGDRYKACTCISHDSFPPSLSPDYPSDDQIAIILDGLPDWTPASYAPPANQAPVCQNAGWSAPQRDGDGSPSVQSSINQWCSDNDGKTVNKNPGVDTVFQMYSYSYYSYWLSATNWYDAPGGNGCGDTATISKDECISVLTEAMITCNPNSGQSSGASYVGECIRYNITLDGGADPQSPPWNSLPPSAYGSCDMNVASPVAYNFWQGVYPQFCSQVDANAAQALKKDLTQNDFVAKSKRSIHLRTPPPSTGSYMAKYGNNWNFHYEWTGSNGDCRKNCNDALYTLSQSPCGHVGGQGNNMASAGSLDVGCGTYSYSITPPDPDQSICAVDPSFFSLSPERTFSLADAEDAISKFCADEKSIVSNPMQPDSFLQDKFSDTTPRPVRYYLYGDTTIQIFAAFADTTGFNPEGTCKPDTEFKVKDYEKRCNEVLLKSVNQCNTDTTTDKKSSFTVENEADHGCVVWQIIAYKNGP